MSLEDGQVPLLIVQTNEFVPTESAVTPDVGLPGAVTEPLPAITVQAPVPTEGVLPANDAMAEHTVWSGPASETVGVASLIISTVSFDGVHVPLLIVQTNSFNPTLSPVTPDVGEPGEVTIPPPEIVAQDPVPTSGELPERAALVEQTV